MRTTFAEEIINIGATDTVLTQETPESEAVSENELKFPKRIKHRGKGELTRITLGVIVTCE
jgi:hypothetical protein